MALVNEQASKAANTTIGFANPGIYVIGEGANYSQDFHDIVSGNNNYYDLVSLPSFYAVLGYDLVTGWGSPAGQALIDDLAPATPSGFLLSTSSTALTIKPGNSASVTITVLPQSSFTGSVSLSVSGLPGSVTPSFGTNPTTEGSTLTLTVGNSATRGSYLVTVTGTFGSQISTTNLTLEIDAPAFSLLPSPANLQVAQGASATTAIIVVDSGGFTGNVNLAITSPLPSGVTALWSKNPTSGSSELTLTASDSATAGLVTITGTSGNLTEAASIAVEVIFPSFFINIAPIDSTLAQGGTATAALTVIPIGNLTGTVNLSVTSSLNTNETLSLSQGSITPGETSLLTMSAGNSAPLGNSEVCVWGGSSYTSTGQCFRQTITAAPTPTFTLGVSQPGYTLIQGSSTAETITVTPQLGFSGSVNLSVTGLPKGVTASFAPNSTIGTSVLTLNSTSTAAPGIYELIVNGISGSQSTAALIFLTVESTPNFSIVASSAYLPLALGSSVTDTITVIPQFGFAGSVQFAVTAGLPSGVTASFSPNPATGNSVLTLSASNSTALGNYVVTLTGTSGTQTATSTLFLGIGSSAGSATSTVLTATPSSGSQPAGTLYTLTAAVKFGGTLVTHGTVEFCEASSLHCIDTHLLGTVQLTSSGTATLKYYPPPGNHVYNAVYIGTPNSFPPYPSSTSAPANVYVSAATSTTIASSGSVGNYSLTATIVGSGSTASPSGTASFLDATNGNAVLGSASLSPATENLSFTNPSTPATGETPAAEAVGDFNGDGNLDLAVVNSGDNSVTILLGNGHGGFTAAPNRPTTGNDPVSIVSGDFNNDGILDLAVANYNDNTVTILLGNGDGTFTPAQTSPATGNSPISLATGDFNGDGNLDLAVMNWGDETVTILLGNGDGAFTTATSVSTGQLSYSMAVGDFNGDGQSDLAVANWSNNTVTILLGNGDGTFAVMPDTPITGNYPMFVAVGDFNGDGEPDLAVANLIDSTLTILLGNGNGTFTAAPVSPATGRDPWSVAVGDFNTDGNLDLAVANVIDNTVTILLGNGDGTFSAMANSPATGYAPEFIVAGDFNGDGNPDLATANVSANTVTVLSPSLTETAIAMANGLSPVGTGTHQIEASYPGDSSCSASTSTTIGLTAELLTPAVTVTPGSFSITTTQPLTVTVAVNGGSGNPMPIGSVTLTGGGYSGAQNLIGGSTTFTIAAGSLSTGSYTLTASYTPDSNSSSIYNTATGRSSSVAVTQATQTIAFANPGAQTVGTPLTLSATATSSLTVTFTSTTTGICTVAGTPAVATFVTAGTCTIDANQAGNTTYAAATMVPQSFTVTQLVAPTFTIAGTSVTVTPGASTGNTSTLTMTPAGGFTGSVALTAAITSTPNGAQYLPTLSFGSTSPVSISGETAGTAILTISTTAATSAALVHPKRPGVPWYTAGGATLACLLLFGIPARRRSWRTMFGMSALLVTLTGGVLACGGGGSGSIGSGGNNNPGTTAGAYIITVTGTSGTTTANGTVTLTVQ